MTQDGTTSTAGSGTGTRTSTAAARAAVTRGVAARRATALALAVVLGPALAACQGEATGPRGTDAVATDGTTGPGTPVPSPEPDGPTPDDEPTDVAPTGGDPTDVPATPDGTTNGLNTLVSPTPGETVTGPDVLVTGAGTAFEATLDWRVLRAGTEEVVDEGFTTAGANGEVGPFEIPLRLDPGRYTVEVWEPDASDADPPRLHNLVAVTFTVR